GQTGSGLTETSKLSENYEIEGERVFNYLMNNGAIGFEKRRTTESEFTVSFGDDLKLMYKCLMLWYNLVKLSRRCSQGRASDY
ncbi:hypothetical protein, partial [Escherichia coli]|uniref:hypothetical protein n=1 Tax=Escherichia coli TaxID=562 RepID=UPI001AA15FDF